jgi:hypothetical protein
MLFSVLAAILALHASAAPAAAQTVTAPWLQDTARLRVIPLRTGTAYRFKGFAVDPTGTRFFLGSWDQHQIVAVSGTVPGVTAFRSPYHGRLAGMGVFLRAGKLYALMNEVNDAPDAKASSVLLVFDAVSGTLHHAYAVQGTVEGRHHFNHVVVDSTGRAYVSNTLKGGIWTVNTKDPADSLRPFLIDARLRLIHGIALPPAEDRLFVTSYQTGLAVIDLPQRALRVYDIPASKGTDGLRYYRGSLYGIGQNALTRYHLNADATRVTNVTPLLVNHPAFNDPRCLDILQDTLFILGNIEHTAVTFQDPSKRGTAQTDTHILSYRLPDD